MAHPRLTDRNRVGPAVVVAQEAFVSVGQYKWTGQSENVLVHQAERPPAGQVHCAGGNDDSYRAVELYCD